jgi:hypothetical protein
MRPLPYLVPATTLMMIKKIKNLPPPSSPASSKNCALLERKPNVLARKTYDWKTVWLC